MSLEECKRKEIVMRNDNAQDEVPRCPCCGSAMESWGCPEPMAHVSGPLTDPDGDPW